jgi:folate-binding protein YgfZ
MGADDNQAMHNEPTSGWVPDGVLRLQDWGLMTATGPDSASFLNGQLTQDLVQLPLGQARLAGYCSAKGRLLATFWAWRTGPDTFALACSADLLAPTLKRLSMFVLRAKCKLAAGTPDQDLFGLAGPAVARWWAQAGGDAGALPTPGQCVQQGPSWWVRLPDVEGVSRVLLVQPALQPPPALPALSAQDWAWLEVRSGIARVTSPTVEQFVPQMVNLELTGGVHFQKGCYPGQEVVARSQYRGTLKRRMYRVVADAPLQAGAELMHSADPGQPAGMVVLAAPSPAGGWEALVELKTALAASPGSLGVGTVAVRLADLPYGLPADASA